MDPSADPPTTRSGHVALVGRPNVGKSTLLNALVGEKLSIVTPRAQTTRESVTGILTTPTMQAIFVDTPGLLEPRYVLQRAMHDTALEVLRGADVVVLLLDVTRPDEVPPADVVELLMRRQESILAVINKMDASSSDAVETLERWCGDHGLVTLAVSAVDGTGVAELTTELEARLPAGPFYYPEDELAVQPVRFFVAELIRETIFEMYEQEVPYSAIARVEEYREGSDPLFIRATVYVERESQKPIVIGRGGAGIRELGRRSREKIEAFVGQRVYLDLRVKALPNWRSRLGTLRYLGYRLPASLAAAPDDPGFPPPGRKRTAPRGRRRGE
ncbi:MAG TPA: GTPase Era [Longimicrobiales bacterium]|nr:GTPase Era [Longimicrobiales bacterium]